MRRILGVDPGLASTGYGLIESDGNHTRLLSFDTISTKASWQQGARLLHIHEKLSEVLAEFRPLGAGVESLYFSKNVSSALPVAEARGVVLLCLQQAGIEVLEFTPPQLKLGVVGDARADKQQVQEMVRIILGLAEVPKPDHAADALAAAICFANSGRIG